MVEGWQDDEGKPGSLRVPKTVIVTRDYSESILAGTEIAIKRLAARSRFLPVLISAFQFVSETYLLGSDKAQRRVINFEVSRESGKTETRLRRITPAVSNDPFDMDRRRH